MTGLDEMGRDATAATALHDKACYTLEYLFVSLPDQSQRDTATRVVEDIRGAHEATIRALLARLKTATTLTSAATVEHIHQDGPPEAA